MKERDELRPENRQPASQASKDEFVNSVDLLTEKGYASPTGYRLSEYQLSEDKKAQLFYHSAEGMKNIEHVSEDPTHIQINIVKTISEDELRMTCYYLKRSGALEQHTGIRNLKKEREEEFTRLAMEERGERNLFDELMKIKEKIDEVGRNMAQSVAMGLAFVSEADLSEINKILRELLAKQKK